MKKIQLIIASSTLLFLFSCGQKTAETSKFKHYIAQMDSVMNIIQKEEQGLADSLTLVKIANYSREAKQKYGKIQGLLEDSIMPAKAMLDNAKLVRDYRGALIKGIGKNSRNKLIIDKELPITKEQFERLRENLVYEKIQDDSVAMYVEVEMNYATQLIKVMEQYNLLNNSALKYYESNTPGIDSLINAYTNDSTSIE